MREDKPPAWVAWVIYAGVAMAVVLMLFQVLREPK